MEDKGDGLFIRANKAKARRLYNEGITLYVVPCNVYPDFNSKWYRPCELSKKEIEIDFDKAINNFEYYNCNTELGRYSAYYIK